MRGWRDPVLGCGLVVQLTIVIVAILMLLGIGILLDRLAHTSPLLTCFATFFGITIGTIAVYRAVAAEYTRVGGSKP